MSNHSTNVYVITCLINDKKYIGFTKKLIEERLKGHFSSARNNSKFALHEAIRKYGKENFVINLFSQQPSRILAGKLEQRLIIELCTHVDLGKGYNMTSGGEGIVGISLDGIKRMGDAHKRENLKESTIEKMRNAKLGRELSSVTKSRMSESHTGKKFTEEHKQKIGNANKLENCSLEKRKKLSEAKSRKVVQIDKNGIIIKEFQSIKIASQVTGIHATNISACCLGNRKFARGFSWKYCV